MNATKRTLMANPIYFLDNQDNQGEYAIPDDGANFITKP